MPTNRRELQRKEQLVAAMARRTVSRRAFLHCGMVTAGGSNLIGGLQSEAVATSNSEIRPDRDTSVILLWMDGGASHFETFDPRPDAPAEVRGEFGSIATTLPGVRLCEHLPRTAGLTDRLAIIRSMTHQDGLHEGGIHWMQTGYGYPRQFDPVNMRRPRHPAVGAVVAQQRGAVRPHVPPYVKVFKDGGYEHSYQGASYLGHQFEPFEIGTDIRSSAFRETDPFHARHIECPALSLSSDMVVERLQQRRRLLTDLNTLREQTARSSMAGSMDAFRGQAWDLLLGSAMHEVFDLSREPQALRERYGRHLWGQGTLVARRLVEAGVRFVTVNLHGDPPLASDQFSWDTHVGHFPAMKDHLLPAFDQLFSALIDDLWQRGLNERVLVLAVGEFGRSPRIFSDGRPGGPGRTHWPQVFSAVLAGGGIRGGQVIGESSRDGGEVKDRPIAPQDLYATIYSCLGVDPHTLLRDNLNRPFPILPNGDVVRELLD